MNLLVNWSFSCSKNSVYASYYCIESLVVPCHYVLSYSQGSVRNIWVTLIRKRQALSDSASFVACEQRNRNLMYTAFFFSDIRPKSSLGTVILADSKIKRCNATFYLVSFRELIRALNRSKVVNAMYETCL